MSRDTLRQILDFARWAPSGDNTQPWRLEIASDNLIRVHGHDTRDHVLYDFEGHPGHIAHGALLETLRIAASSFGLKTSWTVASSGEHRSPVYDVTLIPGAAVSKDPLFDFITTRTVQRRPMQTTPLNPAQRKALHDATGPGFNLELLEPLGQRLQIAKLLWNSAHIRLTCPEAYPVHRDIIEWNARYSKDRIPDQAVGVDPATSKLMKFVLQSWERVDFFNKYLMGTVPPRIQLDWLPAVCCAAHLLVRPARAPVLLEDWVKLGETVQRIWLTAAAQGLHFQPEMTPVIFRWYARSGQKFSAKASLFDDAIKLSTNFEGLVGAKPSDDFGFFARVGTSKLPHSRSIRQDLNDLLKA